MSSENEARPLRPGFVLANVDLEEMGFPTFWVQVSVPSSLLSPSATRCGVATSAAVDCGTRERLEFDHIIPWSEGGSNTVRNLELRCEDCTGTRGTRI